MTTTNNEPKATLKTCEAESDLPKPARIESNALINQLLADVGDLRTQLNQAHWNEKGPYFIRRHELFDRVVREVEINVVMVTERIVLLGGIAEGTVRSASPGQDLGSLWFVKARSQAGI
jgi:starvation-inducible DNA-binding protein